VCVVGVIHKSHPRRLTITSQKKIQLERPK
jgi:hypothetical protein